MTVTTYQEFVAAQEREKYPPDPEQLASLNILFSDPSVPISQLAKQIAGPILKEIEKNPGHPVECSILWRTISRAIKQFTEYNDKLVELVVELQKVPDPTGYIADMNDMGMYWTEFAFNFKDPISTDPEREAKRQAWINMNAFEAKLSTQGVPALDERHRAAAVMRETLEKTPWETYHHADLDEEEDPEWDDYPAWRAHEFELRDVKTLDSTVPAAAVWIKINGKGLYKMEGEMATEYDFNKTNWKGAKGWSKERFAFWRERFEWISKVSVLNKKTKDDAREAAALMKKIIESEK